MAELVTRIVIRNDSTANWLANESVVLLKGETGYEFLSNGKVRTKVGDGVKTWAELDYSNLSNHYETTLEADETKEAAIARAVGENALEKGDTAVVKALINGEKYEYTAYVYNGTEWAAMDGNYNAKNVYFDEDFTFTKAVGTVTIPSTGSTTRTAAGKNVQEFFAGLFAEEQNPTIKQPSASITCSLNKAYEVGSKVSPTYSVSFDDGNYQYGTKTDSSGATGVTVTSYAISDTAGNTATTQSGTMAEVTVEDNTSYKVTAVVSYSDGAIPVTNLGNEYADGQIKAGTLDAVASAALTGYRNTFYGTKTEKTTVDSAAIRTLTASGKALANGSTFDVSVPVGALRVIIAYPATLRDITSIQDNNDSMSNIVSSFTKSTVAVEGANGATAIDYKVYTMDFANPYDTANKFTVTI